MSLEPEFWNPILALPAFIFYSVPHFTDNEFYGSLALQGGPIHNRI